MSAVGPDAATGGRRYLDEKRVAQALSVSTRTLQRWRRDGGGPPYIRAGSRRVVYDARAIENWSDAHSFPHRAAELARTQRE